MMAVNKTQPSADGVAEFLAGIANPDVRAEAEDLAARLAGWTGAEPVVWGKALGFGRVSYRYASGRTGEWYRAGFAVVRDGFSLHLGCGLDTETELLSRLGRHRVGKGCLTFKRLSDLDPATLESLVRNSLERLESQQPDPGA